MGGGEELIDALTEAAAPASSQIKSHIGSSGRSFGLPQPARTTPDNFLDFVFLTLSWWRPWGLFKDWGRWQWQVDNRPEKIPQRVWEGWGIIKSFVILLSLLLAFKLKALVMTPQFKQQQLHTGMFTTGHSLWFTLLISIYSAFKDKHMTDDSEVSWPSYTYNQTLRSQRQQNKTQNSTKGFLIKILGKTSVVMKPFNCYEPEVITSTSAEGEWTWTSVLWGRESALRVMREERLHWLTSLLTQFITQSLVM